MRLTRQKRITQPAELNMAAMIDVIMLLIIFFMCTTTFKQPEKRLDTTVAKIGKGAAAEAKLFEPVEICITKSSDGKYVILCDAAPCNDFRQLTAVLKQRKQIADVDVVVKGDSDVPFWYMVAAVDSSYKAGLRHVAFSTKGIGQ